MPTVTLKAHYDGKHIVLDEPFDLPMNAALAVTLLSPMTGGDDRQWYDTSAMGLGRAYADDEPDYSPTDIQP